MNQTFRKVSTITDKGQTTVPKPIREALGVDFGGRIAFCIDEANRVYVERDDVEESDPVMDSFLDFLAKDMTAHPERSIAAFPPALKARMEALVGREAVDLDQPIEGEVDL
ncbi:type II toxin-antitoxin system PrlF family antitoxin [Rhizobium sp. AAP43]|uniref:type II toxin-antitoxin system PrlF family antitoxin n=1 Tax=Rhizobium sp. AAP43 TaxID=1523420 RepID=UPI0006B9858C|nr:type II toxin-antitoxin system PrlF family antitoxin [Rhizobium sp. AAP43]KPF41102.1 AbrB family transcriptional regulator [Rhizobium sp. AAP43]